MRDGSARATLALPLILGLLAACSSILPAPPPAPDLYQLSPVALKPQAKPIAAQIVVDVPLASRGLDTDRIVVRNNPYEVKYLAGVRWSDRAPLLVQSALIQGLESAGAFTGVGRPEDGIRSSYALMSDLRAFDVLSGGVAGRTKVQIVLAAKLVQPGGDVVASRLITKEAETKSNSDADVVAAFDEAVKAFAEETTKWVVSSAASAAKAAPPPEAAETAPAEKPAP
jgi:cholesterol transport system auxiliary component